MLFNLFSKNIDPPKKVIVDEMVLDGLYIEIKYDLQNNLVISADYNDKTDPNIIAQALFMLNTGQLLSSILESLLKNSSTYTKQIMLQKILTSCNKLITYNNDECLVKPSNVFIRKNEE